MTRRITAAVAALCATGTLIALSAGGVGAHPTSTRAGKADSGTVYLSTVRAAGKSAWGAGVVFDKLAGQEALVDSYTVSPQNGKLVLSARRAVLYNRTGSLSGTLSAIITIKGTSETVSDGKLDLTHGAGSQKGHSLVGTYSGKGDTATNRITLHYKGTYK